MEHVLENPEFWVLVAFAIFIAAVGKKAYQAITGRLDARADQIKQELDEALRLREEAQALLAGYQRQQRDAGEEAEEILDQAKLAAEADSAAAAADLKALLERRTRLAEENIAQAEARALKEIRETTVDVAVSAARRLIAESLDGKRADALVEDAIGELEEKLQ